VTLERLIVGNAHAADGGRCRRRRTGGRHSPLRCGIPVLRPRPGAPRA
jgi:hypothetical protein